MKRAIWLNVRRTLSMFATRTRTLALAAALVAPVVFADGKPDAENGKTIFEQRCGICHAVNNEPGAPVLGPSMVGLVGRKAGTQKDFPLYTQAMKDYGVKWSAKTLDEFLVNPMIKVPGTTMPMVLPDDQERADVIAYLSSLK
jgi:cytochrome c